MSRANSKQLPDDGYLLRAQALDSVEKMAASVLANDRETEARAMSLYAVARRAVELLGEIARKKPDALRPIAESTWFWPSFISPHGDADKANSELIEHLKVGSKHYLRTRFHQGRRGKRWSLRTQANLLAIGMIAKLRSRKILSEVGRIPPPGSPRHDWDSRQISRLNLQCADQSPTLTKMIRALKQQPSATTALQWFQAGWQMVLDCTNGQPEKDPRLRDLGLRREKHSKTSPKGSRTSEANIRDGIKARLRGAFEEVISSSLANSE